MSLPINFGRLFENITKTFNGAAVVSVTDKVLKCSSTASEVSRCQQAFLLRPGDALRFRVMARKISGDSESCFIKTYYRDAERNTVFINSRDWQWYEIVHANHSVHAELDWSSVWMGVVDTKDGNVEFTDPHLELITATYAPNRVIACGLVNVVTGVATLAANYTNHGMRGFSYDAATYELVIQTDPTYGRTATSPIPFIQMGAATGLETQKFSPRFTAYNAATGEFRFKFYRGDTWAVADLAAYGAFSFVFEARII